MSTGEARRGWRVWQSQMAAAGIQVSDEDAKVMATAGRSYRPTAEVSTQQLDEDLAEEEELE